MELLRSARLSFAVSVGILLLALWYGGTLWATDRGIRNVEAHVTTTPPSIDLSEPWRAMRFFGDPDAYLWLSFTRDLRASDHFRVRYTFADNAPYGREVHWAQLPIWGLAGLSFAIERAAGLSPPRALEWAGRLLMPLLGFIFFSALLIVLAKCLDPPIALLAVLTMALTCNYEFHPLRPDHHGFQIAFATGCLVFLLRSGLGWVRLPKPDASPRRDLVPGPDAARRTFVASGILGGMALWLGATVFAFILFALAAGIALSLLLSDPSDAPDSVVLRPDLFRWWGLAGAGSSLFFYLLEYATNHFSMRLEVNHPLYALCFLGTAECLRAIARWKLDRATFRLREGLPALLGFLAAAMLPLLILFGPSAWYLPRLPIMLRLHSRFITEFLSPLDPLVAKVYLHDPLLPLSALAALGIALFLLRGKRLPFPFLGPLRVLATATGMLFLLFCWQGRWLQLLPPAYLLLAAFSLTALRQRDAPVSPRPRVLLTALLMATLLLQAGQAARFHLRSLIKMVRVEQIGDLWNRHMLQRNVLLQLKAERNGVPMRLILPVEMAPAAYYFGVGDAIGSLYWENLEGLTAAAEFMAEPLSGERAREIARERGITHVVSLRIPEEARMCYYLRTGKEDLPGISDTFGYALSINGMDIPTWAQPDYPLLLAASQTYYIYIPSIAQWISEKPAFWIYRLHP